MIYINITLLIQSERRSVSDVSLHGVTHGMSIKIVPNVFRRTSFIVRKLYSTFVLFLSALPTSSKLTCCINLLCMSRCAEVSAHLHFTFGAGNLVIRSTLEQRNFSPGTFRSR